MYFLPMVLRSVPFLHIDVFVLKPSVALAGYPQIQRHTAENKQTKKPNKTPPHRRKKVTKSFLQGNNFYSFLFIFLLSTIIKY